MATPTAKKGRTTLLTSDPCPRGCRTGARGAIHLLSDHTEERTRQCNLCACVVQDVAEAKAGS
jgi:hypothetical protein